MKKNSSRLKKLKNKTKTNTLKTQQNQPSPLSFTESQIHNTTTSTSLSLSLSQTRTHIKTHTSPSTHYSNLLSLSQKLPLPTTKLSSFHSTILKTHSLVVFRVCSSFVCICPSWVEPLSPKIQSFHIILYILKANKKRVGVWGRKKSSRLYILYH